MRHALVARFACACAFAVTAFARAAAASEPALELDYEAPSACPSEATFLSDVQARLAGRPAAASDARRFRVRIVEQRGGYRGALEALDPPSERDVSAHTCDEVVRALVVFVALAVSPVESAESVAPPPPPPPLVTQRPPPAVTRTEPRPEHASSAGSTRGPVGLGLDVRAVAAFGVTPGTAPGASISGRLVVETRPSFRWIVHAGGVAAYREKAVLEGSFAFLWWAARVDAGPALDLGPFQLSGGPALRAGVLSVSARDLPSAGRYSSFWGDVGGFLRVDRALTSSIALSLMAELAVPVKRRTFGIERVEEPVHEIGPVVGLFSVGATFGR